MYGGQAYSAEIIVTTTEDIEKMTRNVHFEKLLNM